jgi:hypothetical protein
MHSWIVVYKLTRVLIEAPDMAGAWEEFILQFPRQRVKPTLDEVTIRPATDSELLEFSRRRARKPETVQMFDPESYSKRKARVGESAPRRAKARTDHPVTSHDAARAAQSSSETQRARLLSWLRGVQSLDARFHKGATDEEMQTALRMNPSTQRPRRVELVEEGLIVDSGERRPTRSGRAAIVWAACPF